MRQSTAGLHARRSPWISTARGDCTSTPQEPKLLVGADPPPMTARVGTTRAPLARMSLSSFRARFFTSMSGSVIILRTGMLAVFPWARSFRVSPREAMVNLSTRTARCSGCLAMVSTRSALPRMMPAWGPPSTLSPLKHSTSEPCCRHEGTVHSPGMPWAARSKGTPEPMSTKTGMPNSLPSAASSPISTSSVNPTTEKLLRCTFMMSPVALDMASR